MYYFRYLTVLALLYRAKSRKSLTDFGLVVAGISAFIHTLGPSSLNLVLLAVFFLTSTQFGKVKAEYKNTLTAVSSTKAKEARNHSQVLANSAFASFLILVQHFYGQFEILTIGVIAQYAAVCADTWASELGILSKSPPILITTLRPCPRGTNGGVSLYGLQVSVAGGVLMGIVGVLIAPMFASYSVTEKVQFIAFTGVVGLFGSLLDSLLGALFQNSVVNSAGKIIEQPNGYVVLESEGKLISGNGLLDNNQVNFLMASHTAILTMALWWIKFGSIDDLFD
jgi:uncharacterized protein (TIGR00297 family)